MTGSIRVGIVGAGLSGNLQAGAIKESSGIEVAAVVDTDRARLEAFSREWGISPDCCFTSISTLCNSAVKDSLSFVVIATPSGTHLDNVQAAANYRLNVVCEKPPETSPKRTEEMISYCTENVGVNIDFIMQNRFGEHMQLIKRDIAAGLFGEILEFSAETKWYRRHDKYFVTDGSRNWRGTWRMDGGGALANQGSHCLDAILWLLEDKLVYADATAETKCHDIETEDFLTARLRFEKGASGALYCSTNCYPGSPVRIEIFGTKRSVKMSGYNIVEYVAMPDYGDPEKAIHLHYPATETCTNGASNPALARGHARQLLLIGKAMEGQKHLPTVTPSDALNTVYAIAAIYKSVLEGRAIEGDIPAHVSRFEVYNHREEMMRILRKGQRRLG